MHIMFLKVHCSSFSAAACMFDGRPLIKPKLNRLTDYQCFNCDQKQKSQAWKVESTQ